MRFGLSKKIWFCIGILMFGYAFSVSRTLLAERQVRARLLTIRQGLLPAQQYSQMALDSFKYLRTEYQDAVTFGEAERLQSTQKSVNELVAALDKIADNPHVEAAVRKRAVMFRDRIQAYSRQAVTTYSKLLNLESGEDTNLPMETLRALTIESEALTIELSVWNEGRKEALTNNHAMISSVMQKEITVDMILLVVVTLLSGTITYVIISKKIIAPLNQTVRLAKQISDGNYAGRLDVKGGDEMSQLGRAFNRMTEKLEATLSGLKDEVRVRRLAENELKELNEQLEHRVSDRTEALSKANDELNQSFEDLKMAQQQLVEVEKMASLGELVAGVAHEINTPVGIGVTVASHLRSLCDQLMAAYEKGELRKSSLTGFLDEATEGVGMLLENLQRAAALIQSFKQVAVDQSSEDLRTIDVVNYVREVVASLTPRLRRTNVQVDIEATTPCEATTYPGALAQIVTNLINNSLVHGFEDADTGSILIKFRSVDDDRIEIVYSDDGSGMDEQVLERIFNPFFTTKRGNGGSGLGMHIIYNLVTQRLKGTISCTSSQGEGFETVINFPTSVDADDDTEDGSSESAESDDSETA